jgi:hypothetical protein
MSVDNRTLSINQVRLTNLDQLQQIKEPIPITHTKEIIAYFVPLSYVHCHPQTAKRISITKLRDAIGTTIQDNAIILLTIDKQSIIYIFRDEAYHYTFNLYLVDDHTRWMRENN